MAKLFISYSSNDRAKAQRLATSLKDAGNDVWFDRWSIIGKDPYWDEIQRGIESCEFFIFAISSVSIDREGGAYKELSHATGLPKAQRSTIIPVMLEPVAMTDLPLLISPGQYHIHSFVNDSDFEACLLAIVRLMGSPTATPIHPPTKSMAVRGISRVAWFILAALLILIVGAVIVMFSQNRNGDPSQSSLVPTLPPSSQILSSLTPVISAVTASIVSTKAEAITSPTSPIPTNAATVTLGADVTLYRSPDSLAVCAGPGVALETVKVALGTSETYLASADTKVIQAFKTNPGGCFCVKQSKALSVHSGCEQSKTIIPVSPDQRAWSSAAVNVSIGDKLIGICQAQLDQRTVYFCPLQ